MPVDIRRPGRLVGHTDDWAAATLAEIDTAFRGYNGCAGSFEVDYDLPTLHAGLRLLRGAPHSWLARLVWDRIR